MIENVINREKNLMRDIERLQQRVARKSFKKLALKKKKKMLLKLGKRQSELEQCRRTIDMLDKMRAASLAAKLQKELQEAEEKNDE